ncbi:MAG: nucleotidyltransferase domain-containing protein [Alphaproteobacteria bacterium]|nr:nucleotidyltransferase domain-containing protein [Alphaproteobacteria bacterium]MCB9686178.1 nucleotidyltransferase domain-containing protein [Alphaproteobacteria bacterium]MCB9700067.1 nucleotidyltransferase domain-containing protein [Alphaproteobacteria bacterium]MCB9776930.1 nucleotidyltransferase domain-containing protein [Alphaproteobacteria bacterium]
MNAFVPIDDPALERLLRRVVDVMRPLEVWLFGSRAEGRARPDSDYDLLVVLPDDVDPNAFDPVQAWKIGREVRVSADIVPCTHAEFVEDQHEIDTLARAAVTRGRKIFEH